MVYVFSIGDCQVSAPVPKTKQLFWSSRFMLENLAHISV
jgi:hypothetical protein